MRVLRISHSAVVDAWRDRERAIQKRGVDIRLLSARVWDEGGSPVPLRPRPGEAVEGLRTWGSHPALFLYDPRPIWRALGQHWDVIDIHEEPFALATAEILAIRAFRRIGTPFTLYSAQNIDKRYPPPFRWFERWSLRRAAGVSVCNSEAAAIVERKGLSGRASVIDLGIDTARFQPGPQPGPARVRATIVVGFAGRLAPHKGVSVLLDAIAGDDRLSLRVAGRGPAEQDLRERATRLAEEGRVEFLGSVDQADLPDFYRSLDVLAVPSLATQGWVEQFGRVAVEAMACGTPVVASDTGALRDVVGGAGLLVPPADSGSLCSALVSVGTDEGLAARLRTSGLERAQQADWRVIGDRYLEMYNQAAHVPGMVEGRDLEIIVVAYGSPELLARALAPVRHLPVTVVDNSSSPDVLEVCADAGVVYLDPGQNGGFAAGVNAGLAQRQRPGADVLLLNPDAVVSEADIRELHRALLADPSLASVGPAQVDEEGIEARVGWPFPSPARAWLEAIGLGRLRPRADFVIGSVLLLRAEAIAQVGGLDERFFLYSEETDWAYRASRLGWHHAVVPTATAVHAGAGTSTDPARREAHFHASQERYLRKHFGSAGWQLARAGQLAGSAVRSVVLRDDRGRTARDRLAFYRRGPLRAERALSRPDDGGAAAAPGQAPRITGPAAAPTEPSTVGPT